MEEKKLPFPLYKNHKYYTLYEWKSRGIIFESEDHKEEIYQRYIYSSHCELCGKEFPNSLDRHLEHEHEPTKPNFRSICCNKCNKQKKDVKIRTDNTTGEQNISKCKNKNYAQGFCYTIEIRRDGKYVLNRKRKTLEEAIICRDKFIKEHPEIYS